MEISGKTIVFSNTLWVQHGGVRVKNEKESVLVEGVDDDSYLKVFNHFGRVLRLYTFEEGQWVDSATGAAPTAMDESLAGQVPATKHTSTVKATVKPTAKPPRAKAKGKAPSKSKATAKTAVKTKANPAAAAKKTGAGKAISGGKAAAKSKAASRSKAAAKTSKQKATGKDK